jgi:hypothetical protein
MGQGTGDFSLRSKTNDIDLSLLEYHLSLSPEERLRQHQRALNLTLQMKNAGQEYYARLRESPQSSSRS